MLLSPYFTVIFNGNSDIIYLDFGNDTGVRKIKQHCTVLVIVMHSYITQQCSVIFDIRIFHLLNFAQVSFTKNPTPPTFFNEFSETLKINVNMDFAHTNHGRFLI